MRLIDAQRFVDTLLASHDEVLNKEVLQRIEGVVSEMPTIDPVKHGHWIEDSEYDCIYACSNCGDEVTMETPYCRMCGSKMEKAPE